jgi:photosystem II stability/assembly factor-like uncharacterized protein
MPSLRPYAFGLSVLLATLAAGGCDLLGEEEKSSEAECTPNASTSGPVGEWEFLGLGGKNVGDVAAVAVDPCNPRVIYAGSQFDFSGGILGKLFRSTDGGETWDTLRVEKPRRSYREITFAPSAPDVVYAAHGGLLKSTDGGQSWTAITPDVRAPVQSLAIHPERADVLYAGAGSAFVGGDGLYKSTDGGENWREVGEETALEQGVSSIAIDPGNPDVVYAGTAWSASIAKSTDGGESWLALAHHGGIVLELLVEFESQGALYAGVTRKGIQRSEDEGATWHSFNQGLPPDTVNVSNIEKGNPDEFFVTSSWGETGGVYRRSPTDSIWTRIGVPAVEQSYYYSDLELTDGGLYVGLDGVYRLNLE